MPLEGNHAGGVGLETPEGSVCVFDVKDGKIKDAHDIFEGGVVFFIAEAADGDLGLRLYEF